MAFLKFNKSELVNLSYSLRREMILASKTGACCNTSIVTCNTRKYHGLLSVTLDRFGGDRYMMLSSVDETLFVNGKPFNLGIHCYGDIYEPRGHKYIVDLEADPVWTITCKVGEVVFRKSIILAPEKDQVLLKYEVVEAPSAVELQLRPFLSFRNIHQLTHRNAEAKEDGSPIPGGMSFRMYSSFPDLFLQLSDSKAKFVASPNWNMNITYSDEYRRGFDCREDLLVPGWFTLSLKKGESVVLSAATKEEIPSAFKRDFSKYAKASMEVTSNRDQLVRCADMLVTRHNGRSKINAGYSWLYNGLLRETLESLPGLVLYGLNNPALFEEILDNLITDDQERLYHATTQVEAPLYMASILQAYIAYGAAAKKVWTKYGEVVKKIVASYLPGVRKEVSMHPNGLLWAQMDGVALSWMNAYLNGRAVTERAGYQVETNALWYNAVCFAVEMEKKYGVKNGTFVKQWTEVKDLIKLNYQKTFYIEERGYLADYVDNFGQNKDVRPNQLLAAWVEHSPIDEEIIPGILRVVSNELVTARGIRTLSPRDPRYKGVYEGSQVDRDLAYHQGSTSIFLLAPYVELSFRVQGPSFWKRAEWLVEGFYDDLSKHGVGAFSELYDGDPPHEAHGAVCSAISTASLLYVEHLLEKYKEDAK